jgi:phage shock protein C
VRDTGYNGGKMKRLYKSRKNKMIDGVCGGIAEYFDVDPTLVRVVFILFLFIGGSAIIAYIFGMIIIPVQPVEEQMEKAGKKAEKKVEAKPVEKPAERPRAETAAKGSLILGIILIAIGTFFLMGRIPIFHNYYWWVKSHFWEYFIPAILIFTGIAILVKSND